MRTKQQIQCDITLLNARLKNLELELKNTSINYISLGDVFNITTSYDNTFTMMYVAIEDATGFTCLETDFVGTYLGHQFGSYQEALSWLNSQPKVEYLGKFEDLYERKC